MRSSRFYVKTGNDKTGSDNRGEFKAESFLDHITRRRPTPPVYVFFYRRTGATEK